MLLTYQARMRLSACAASERTPSRTLNSHVRAQQLIKSKNHVRRRACGFQRVLEEAGSMAGVPELMQGIHPRR